MADRAPELKQELYGWQIFTITISSVIGVGIFFSDGEALEVAGPGGILLAFGVVAVVAICVMECISEMIQMFPTPNAIMEFVRAFVDRDLAWVVGIAYWYTYSAIFATQIIAAASFTEYWGLAQVYRTIFFYVIVPFVILAINFAGVFWYGLIETISGILKICLVLGAAIFLYIIHGKEDIGSADINEGFQHKEEFAFNNQIAGCFVVPLIAYSFLGVEMVSVTAYEARDLRSLRWPSRTIAYCVFILYFLCALGEALNVDWENTALPDIYGGVNEASVTTETTSPSRAIVVIAALQSGYKRIPGFLNGCMIFSALSAANTSLYVASRTLYGMTRTVNPWRWFRLLRELGSVWHKTGVPMRALFASFLAFLWLPYLQLKGGVAVQDLLEIMSVSASVSCLLVWASQCLAFIRYWAWLRKHREAIAETYPEYNRWASTSQSSTFLAGLQPLIAGLGLVGSLVIVFIFTTATWWNSPVEFRKVAVAYGAPIVLFAIFVALKLFTRRRPVRLSDEYQDLVTTIEYLRYLKPERQQRGSQGRGDEVELQDDRDQTQQLQAPGAPKPPSGSGYSSSSAAAV